MKEDPEVTELKAELETMRVQAAVAKCTARLVEMELRKRPKPISHDPLEGYSFSTE